jgi:hypothetical protein
MLSARASTPAKAVEDSSPDVGAALPVGGAVATALFLQRSAGNAAVARLLGRKLLRQGNPDAGPPPSDAGAPGGTEKVTLGKFDIWLEPATQRRHVEGMVADKGFAEPRRFLDEASLELDRQTPDAGVPDNQADLEKARPALASYKQVIATFESDVEAFLTDFETKGRKVAGGLLDDSEARAKAEGIKYGITAEQIQKTINRGTHEPIEVTETHYHMDKESPEAATVAAAAKKLLERRAEIAPIKKKRADAQLSYARGFGPAGGGPVPPPPPELATLDAQIAEKELAYDMLANELSARHPSLANAAREKDDTSALQTLAAGPSDASAQIIGSQIADTLTKIAKVRKELEPGGGVNIYKLPKIVALTKAQAAATDWKGKAVDEKIQKAQADEATIAIALGVLNLALLALAPATGGASLVVAAGISSVAAVEHAQEYMLEAAMSGSDVDKARALSQDDPSLFWLAADIVFAMVDIGQAASAAAKLLGTFRRLAPIAREIKVAESAEDAKKAVEALEKAAAEAGGEKLAQKVAESAKGEGAVGKVLEDVEAVEGTARAAETELKAAGEASAEGGRHVHVTNRGKLFSCSSPCTEIRAKYGETLARKPDLMGQVEKLENEAKALGEKATKQQLDAVAAKVLQLDDVIGGAARLERAEKIVAWLKTVEEQFPIVKGLDAEQLARVIEKTNVSHIKG